MVQLLSSIPVNPRWIAAVGGAAAIERGYGRPVARKNGALVIPVDFSRGEKRVLRKRRPVQPSTRAAGTSTPK